MTDNHKAAFSSASACVVRAIKQREHLNEWLRAYGKRGGVPHFDDYRPERLAEEIMDTAFYQVDGDADGFGIIIERDAVRMAQAYGKTGKGQRLDDYLGPELSAIVMPAYRECLLRKRPVYTVSTVVDAQGRVVDYERLLLPFSDGYRIDRMIASLKAISEDGHFELRNMMRANAALPKYTLQCVIDQNLNQLNQGRIASDSVIEFV